MVESAISAGRGGIEMKPGVNFQHISGIKVVTSDSRIVWREVMFFWVDSAAEMVESI